MSLSPADRAATVQSLAESATGTASTQSVDQIMLTPHRVFAATVYTKQLLLQSSPSVEAFIRDDLLKQIAIQMGLAHFARLRLRLRTDRHCQREWHWLRHVRRHRGMGQDIGFRESLSLSNADRRPHGLGDDSVRAAKWKAIPKVAASTFPIFLWEDGQWNDADNDGQGQFLPAA